MAIEQKAVFEEIKRQEAEDSFLDNLDDPNKDTQNEAGKIARRYFIDVRLFNEDRVPTVNEMRLYGEVYKRVLDYLTKEQGEK